MTVDALELRIVSALQRFSNLQRRVPSDSSDAAKLLERAVSELGTALDELRAAQDQIVEHRRRAEALQGELSSQNRKYWHLLDRLPHPCLLTKRDSSIIEANRVAAELLNVSQRFLSGRALSVFVCEDRARFLADASHVPPDGSTSEIAFRLRPRERAPLSVVARVSSDDEGLLWILQVPSKLPSDIDAITR